MVNLSDYFSPQERAALQEKFDWKAAWEVAHTWLWIAVTFALVAWFPNVFTVIIALFILGGKKLT